MQLSNRKPPIVFLVAVLFFLIIFPASIFAVTYYSQSSGNFGDVTIWNSAADGSGTQPGGINSTDDFVIQSGHTVTNDGSYTINSLTINSGGTYDGNGNTLVLNGNLTQNGTITDALSDGPSFNFAGSTTQSISGTGNIDFGTVTFSGTGTYSADANFTAFYFNLSGGTFNANSAVITIVGSSLTAFNKTGGTFNAGTSRFQFNTIGNQIISSNDAISFYDLEHSPSLSKSLTFVGDVQFTVTNSFTRGGSSYSIVLNGTSTLDMSGATVIYSGSVGKTVSAEWPTSSLLAPNEVQLTSGITITADPGVGNTLETNNLVINASGAQLSIASGTVQVNSQLTMTEGIIVENGGSFAWGTGTTTLLYNGASQQTVGDEWTSSKAPTNVQVNNSSGASPAVSMGTTALATLTGNLTLTYGSIDYAAGSLSLTVNGDVYGGAGSFGTVNNNTLIVNGATSQITASGQATIYNLTVNSTSGTLSDIVINGTLNIDPGSGNTVTLNGPITLGSGATLQVSSGILDLNGNSVTKSGSNTLTLSASSQLTTGGTTIIGFSTYNLDPTSTILFNGSTTEDIPVGVSYGNIQINKSGTAAIASGVGTITLQDNSDLTLSAGTFDLNSDTLKLGNNSDINIQGGTANLNGGYLSINTLNTNTLTLASGATLQTGGVSLDGFDTYTMQGSLVYNGSSAETIPAGISSVNDLTINNGAGVTAAGNIDVSGTLTLSLGTFTPATINLSGTLTTNGGNFSSSSGTVVFQGSSQQSIGGTSSVNFYSLTLNNSNGIILGHDITIYGVLSLTSGVLDANSYLVTLATTGSISGGGSTSYVEGKLAKSFDVGTSTSFTFHTAKGGEYLPVTVTFTDITGSAYTVTVEQFNSDPHTDVSSSIDSGTLSAISSVRYWSIQGSGGTPSNLQITLTWNSKDGITTPSALDVAQFNSTQWISVGGDGSGTSTSGTIQSAVITTSGSYYTFGDDAANGQDNSLPVTLATFTAEANLNFVLLKWETESEINNMGFNIYRKTGDSPWEKLNDELIPGAGNSSSKHEYSFKDEQIVPGETYSYRLESVSFNGVTETFAKLTQTVTIPVPTEFAVYPNYPNPFNPETTIRFQLPEQQRVSIYIYDLKGKLIKKLLDNQSFSAGEHQILWNATDENNQQVASGVYLYRFVTPKYSKIGKMTFLK